MGKIHDALEKAHKKSGKPSDTTAKRNDPDVPEKSAVNAQNVVQLQVKTMANSMKYDNSLLTIHNPHSFESEMFKNLRSNILFPENGKRIRTLLITSASSGDGKTFVSTNLACSIAQGIEEYVLLIDCDLRRSKIHKVFGMSHAQGLSDYLYAGKPISDIICKTKLDKLSFIAGGGAPPNPSELLSSNKMASLIKEAKDRYDDRYIILDSPPPMVAAETKALSRLVDGVIIVVKNYKTSKNVVKEIIEELGKDKIIGVVVNYIDKRSMKGQGYADADKYHIKP